MEFLYDTQVHFNEPLLYGISQLYSIVFFTEKKQIYTVYRELVPKRKVFLRYIKSKKKEDWGEIIKFVSEYFMCSLKEAKNYIPLLGKEGIGNLLSEIGTDEKEKKKMLKKIKVDG